MLLIWLHSTQTLKKNGSIMLNGFTAKSSLIFLDLEYQDERSRTKKTVCEKRIQILEIDLAHEFSINVAASEIEGLLIQCQNHLQSLFCSVFLYGYNTIEVISI